jgi:tetratricopeptide (TPR) repeat protein
VFSCLNNEVNSWKSWILDDILPSLKLSSNLNHSLYIILEKMKSNFNSKTLMPINEESNYKPVKYDLMDNWPLIEQNSDLKKKDSNLVFSVLKVLGSFFIKNIKTDQLESYYNENLDELKKEFYSNYKINVSSITNTFELNLNGTFNLDSLLYKLLDANLDNYHNHLIKSQLNKLRSIYEKEVTLFNKTKLISKEIHVEKIKEIMIRLIDVEKDLGSYLESNKNIQIKIKNKDMHPASFLIEPNPYFCGRDEILNDIKIQFENDNKQIVILSSIPGMGKTEIANQYAQNLKKDKPGIIINWFKSDSSDNLLSEVMEFSELFGNEKLTDKEKLIKRVNYKINNSEKKFLFIFDNCEAEDIKDYLINMPNNVKILLTTKIKQENLESLRERIHTIEIESYKLDESKKFTKSILRINDEETEKIFKLLSNHESKLLKPISLNKIVAKIKNEKDKLFISITIEELIENILSELVKDDIIFKLFKDDEEEFILYCLSILDPDFIPVNIFVNVFDLKYNVIERVVKKLDYNLLTSIQEKKSMKGLKIHRTTQEEIRDYLKDKNKYMNVIKKKLISRIVREDLSKDELFKIEHYYNFESILKKLNLLNILSNDNGKSDILNCSGIINRLFEKYNLALEKYTESLRIDRAIYGSDEHSSIATTLHNIGLVYNAQGQYNLALEKYTESLRIYRAIYGSDEHSSIATTFGCIGLVYYAQGQYNLALEKYTESLRIKRAIYGSDEHSSIATTLHNIGQVYNAQGQYNLALEKYTESLRIYRAIYGTDEHPVIKIILNNIKLLNNNKCCIL